MKYFLLPKVLLQNLYFNHKINKEQKKEHHISNDQKPEKVPLSFDQWLHIHDNCTECNAFYYFVLSIKLMI